jgi:hypothetical protein
MQDRSSSITISRLGSSRVDVEVSDDDPVCAGIRGIAEFAKMRGCGGCGDSVEMYWQNFIKRKSKANLGKWQSRAKEGGVGRSSGHGCHGRGQTKVYHALCCTVAGDPCVVW